jgi:hypothetical protein
VGFTIGPERVTAYRAAVGDENVYGDAVPPLFAVAFALEALQRDVMLPEGSLHTGQEVEHSGVLGVGDPLTLSGRVAQRSERQGYVITVLELEVASTSGARVRARATIMAPEGTS